MANRDDGNHLNPPPSSPSTPLHVCGFRTGDAIQVRGDTGELQFSVQFNLRKEECSSDENSNFNIPETETGSPQSSPYLTPTSSTGEFVNHNNDAGGVVTRLRSGILSPVKYYSSEIYRAFARKIRKRKKGAGEWHNVFDEMLKRRDSPLRPCSSYSFFLMKNWGFAKWTSFVETSKRLSRQWSELTHDAKKEYEDMALKDNERYKRQCLLLQYDMSNR